MPYPSEALLPSTTLFPGDPAVGPPPVVVPGATIPWRFVIVNAETQEAIGEPLATGRSLQVGVSATATASFTVRVGSRLWQEIEAGETMLKVYDSTNTLRFYGEVVQDELQATGQGGSVQLTCSDLSWRLSKRLTGKDFDGIGDEYVDRDSGDLIFDVMNQINAEQPTGIQVGNKDTFVTRTMTLLWKPVLQLISELGAIESSYEWQLRYVDGAPPSVYLDLKTRVGTDHSATVFFEYGTGKSNCSGFTRVRSQETSVTRMFALGGGSTVVAEAYDASAEGVRRLEEQISFSDITTPSMVDALAAAHVAFRARPRVIYSCTPFPKLAPVYGGDWVEGDFVTARASIAGASITNGAARIWGASITLDELGNETSSPRMSPDAG